MKRKSYSVITDLASNASFGTIGDINGLHRYKYLYIGKNQKVSVTTKLNLYTPSSCKKLIPANGLLIISDKDLPHDLEDSVLMVPGFISMQIELPNSIEAFYASLPESARSDVRKVKKISYSSSVSKNAAWVIPFFSDYYAPSMQKRHADDAYIMPEKEIAALIKLPGYEFINIYKGDCCVASALTQQSDNSYIFRRVGWLHGDAALINSGAVAAVYWHIIKRAYELDCKKVILGGTPAYLENGVLKFKAKWQARFDKSIWHQPNYLLLNPDNDACYRFLTDVSLIAFSSKNSLIVLSSKYPSAVKMQGMLLDDIEQWYVLQTNKATTHFTGTEDLPVYLRFWYKCVDPCVQ